LTTDERYIKRCLQIGKNGLGSTRPNPMVGAVIVHENTIIGEGFTSPYGGAHAEVNAVNAVKDKTLLEKSTFYVTLEPCSHYGKTPPCSDLIIRHNIPKVVIGCIDDNPQVAGKGIEKLKASGCEVIVGVLEDQCKAHLKRFFTFHNKKRPYIILKWAETRDGFIAPNTKTAQNPVWITNAYSRQLVHKWRAEEQAILVGTTTIIDDNPSLTVRDWTGQHPTRVVLDKDSKLTKSMTVFDGSSKTIIISQDKVKRTHEGEGWSISPPINAQIYLNEHLSEAPINWNFETEIAKQICDVLHKNNINSVIIEGGAKTLQTFIDEGLWDEARVFTGQATYTNGTKAPKLQGKLMSQQHILDDLLSIYKNT